MDHLLPSQRRQPVAVETNLGFFGVQDLEDLRLVGFGVPIDGFARHRRARRVAARRVADHTGHVADQEDDGVAQILKVLHLAQQDGVAQVQVRRGGVKAGLDAQLAAGLFGLDQALAQVFFADDLRHAFAQVCDLLVECHSVNCNADFKSSENFRIVSTCSGSAGVSLPLAASSACPSRHTR